MHTTSSLRLEYTNKLPEITPDLPGVAMVDGFGVVGVSEFGEAHASETTWVQLLPWSEYTSRADALARHASMAKALGHLITIDTPGIGWQTSNLTPGLRKDVAKGNLHGIAEIQWEALMSTRQQALGKVSLLGYSMGTALAAAFVRAAPGKVDIDTVALVEPMADAPTNLVALGNNLWHDSRVRRDYRAMNPPWYRALTPVMPPQKHDLLTYAGMIARGGQFSDVDALRELDTLVVSCDRSTVSPIAGAAALAERLDAYHLGVRDENHSLIDNLGRTVALCEEIARKLAL